LPCATAALNLTDQVPAGRVVEPAHVPAAAVPSVSASSSVTPAPTISARTDSAFRAGLDEKPTWNVKLVVVVPAPGVTAPPNSSFPAANACEGAKSTARHQTTSAMTPARDRTRPRLRTGPAWKCTNTRRRLGTSGRTGIMPPPVAKSEC
jgi:hypothetical protein